MGEAENSVSAFFEKVAAVWGAGDTFATACYTEDGSLINPFGGRADGRAELSAMYREYFGGMLAGTTTSITLTHLRAIEPGYALADADQIIYAPGGEVLLALHVVNFLRKEDDSWLIVDSRPYAFSPVPV
jgi:uncharacterized protein (TIGR02246 family)